MDTSVVGGAFDAEFDWQTEPFWNAVRKGELTVILSDLLKHELEPAPLFVKQLIDNLPPSQVEYTTTTSETDALAKQYIAENVVGQTSFDDCRHIALATLAQADVLVSWNFKHIVNANRIRGYNSVNEKLDYPQIDIRTPYEVNHDAT